jgi:hypothetical protein
MGKLRTIGFSFLLMSAFCDPLLVYADSVGITAPGNAVVRKVQSLKGTESYKTKFLSMQNAIDESDFIRVIELFEKCALQGDPLCQYFLANGVSEWNIRTDHPKLDPRYRASFVRKWLRKAYNSSVTKQLVALNWRTYYLFGYMGFPKDYHLSDCWSDVAVENKTKENIIEKANACRRLEIAKFGPKAKWLSG